MQHIILVYSGVLVAPSKVFCMDGIVWTVLCRVGGIVWTVLCRFVLFLLDIALSILRIRPIATPLVSSNLSHADPKFSAVS